VNVAFVGAGVIALRYADCIRAEPRLTLLGATDPVPGRAEALGGVDYPSLDALLADDAVELVVVLTPPTSHATVARAALEAGKHVYSEKPLALDAGEARSLVELANRLGVRLSAAPATLLGEAQQTAWKFIREGGIGEVRVAYAEANWGRIESWHPAPESLYEVGPFTDVGVYPLTILAAMFGPVRHVTAYATTVVPDRVRRDGAPFALSGPDLYVAVLQHESGVVARLTASFWVSPSKQRGLELHGDGGSLWMQTWHDYDSDLEWTVDGETYTPVPYVRKAYKGVDWVRPLADLADAVRDERPHRLSAELAAHVVEVLAAVKTSAGGGGTIDVGSDFPQPEPMEWAATDESLLSAES
jgi:predicted dehydrogenase